MVTKIIRAVESRVPVKWRAAVSSLLLCCFMIGVVLGTHQCADAPKPKAVLPREPMASDLWIDVPSMWQLEEASEWCETEHKGSLDVMVCPVSGNTARYCRVRCDPSNEGL